MQQLLAGKDLPCGGEGIPLPDRSCESNRVIERKSKGVQEDEKNKADFRFESRAKSWVDNLEEDRLETWIGEKGDERLCLCGESGKGSLSIS